MKKHAITALCAAVLIGLISYLILENDTEEKNISIEIRTESEAYRLANVAIDNLETIKKANTPIYTNAIPHEIAHALGVESEAIQEIVIALEAYVEKQSYQSVATRLKRDLEAIEKATDFKLWSLSRGSARWEDLSRSRRDHLVDRMIYYICRVSGEVEGPHGSPVRKENAVKTIRRLGVDWPEI